MKILAKCNLKKRQVVASVMICLFLFVLPPFAFSQPNKKTQKQTEAKEIQAQIQNMDQELDVAVEEYNQANLKLSRLKEEIGTNSSKIETAKQDLNTYKTILNKRLRNIYKHGDTPFIETILSTKSFDDFLCTVSRLQDIASQDSRTVERIETIKKEIEERNLKLAEQEKSQQTACKGLAGKRSEVQQRLNDRKNALAGVEDEIAAIDREEQAEAERLRARVEAEQRQTRQERVARSPQVSRGGENLPAPKGGVVSVAMQQLGKPYCWGAAGPNSFDCSGLVMYCYARIGISLPHSAAAQYSCGTHVSREQLQPGDLVFFTHGGGGIHHVGMYVGGDSYIHAPHTGDVVKISSLSARGSGYAGAVRP